MSLPGKTPAGNTTTNVFIWIATALLLLAALMRLATLRDLPPGLSQDEVLNADIVSLIRQGQYALFFREGFGHEPLYHYWSTPFQIALGDNFLSIRLPAVFLGLLLIAICMRWAKREFGATVAAVTGLGLAISWWPVIFSRIGLRPVMEPLLLVIGVWFWRRHPWIAGLFFGLSIYTYTAARYAFLIPLAMSVYLLLFHRRTVKRSLTHPAPYGNILHAFILTGVSSALYIPLLITLQRDPTLQQRVEQLSGPLDALAQGDLQPLIQALVSTLGVISFNGDPRWTYGLPGHPLFDPLTAGFFYLGFILTLWHWRRPVNALILIWFVFGLLPSAVTPDAPSTIRLIGCLPVVYLMPGLAISFSWEKWQTFSNFRQSPGMGFIRIGILIMLVAVIVINLWRTARNGFLDWPQALETRLRYQSVIQDMARFWEENPVDRLVIGDSYFEPIDADTFYRNLGGEIKTRWVNTNAAVVVPAGDSPGYFFVPEYAPAALDLLDVAGISPAPLYRSRSIPSFAAYSIPAETPHMPNPMSITFDGLCILRGYDLVENSGGPTLFVYTFWQIVAELPDDLTIFAHLVTEDGAIASQHDGLDAIPQTLRSGDVVIQKHEIDLTELATGDPVDLQVGLYYRTTGLRLQHDGDPADKIVLKKDLTFDWQSNPG